MPCTVLIADPDRLPLLKPALTDGGELLVFAESEMTQALEAIGERIPDVVAMEQAFAASPRGAALINRIKADPMLSACQVRVISQGGGYTIVDASGATPPPAKAAPGASAPALPLDLRGTRRAQRVRISGPLEVLVDGNPAAVVDLSSLGAQVLSATVLKPNQRVRMVMSDDHGTTRFNATVAWAAFEIPPKTNPRYRAGLEFLDADQRILSGYCLKYQLA